VADRAGTGADLTIWTFPLEGMQLRTRYALERLRALADPADAEFLQRFFRTGPGEYGEGDRFLGIRVPAIRAVARELVRMPLAETERLLHSPWHEARLLALILLGDAYRRASAAERNAIFRLYLRNAKYINNWDLVDLSAPNIVGAHLADRPRSRLDALARSKKLWERRIAIVATHQFIRAGEFDDTLRVARILLHDAHDLIHKAVGWMLREVGKRDPARLTSFLDEHAHEMPRTMLRYAIERFSVADRKRYMSARKLAEISAHSAAAPAAP
jgi:3-methyladenine DNA glycosylase AlkD